MGKSGWKESGTEMCQLRAKMRRLSGVGASGALILSAGLCVLALHAQEGATIKVDVNLVRVIATVKNKAGELVGKLTQEDFEILDNDTTQEIKLFAHETDQQLSVALLVDT